MALLALVAACSQQNLELARRADLMKQAEANLSAAGCQFHELSALKCAKSSTGPTLSNYRGWLDVYMKTANAVLEEDNRQNFAGLSEADRDAVRKKAALAREVLRQVELAATEPSKSVTPGSGTH